MEVVPAGRDRRHPEDPRMAGGGDRCSSQGRARPGAHVGPQEGLSSYRNDRRGIRRRRPRCHGAAVGALHDHDDGGISGDLNWTGNAVNNYQRMPHVLTMNPVKQMVPRQQLPDAIITGHATGYVWDGMSQEAQFAPFSYPMPGYSPIHMIYRYGGTSLSTATRSGRWIDAYRHHSIEFVVNQSIWMEGEAQFADIILPACTSLERWDIGEWAKAGGYAQGVGCVNNRVITLQHKCIEPLRESRSDYDISTAILSRLGLGAVFTEGGGELDWVKRVFDSSDLPDHISWRKFCRKGYFVVPPEKPELRAPVDMRWFAE